MSNQVIVKCPICRSDITFDDIASNPAYQIIGLVCIPGENTRVEIRILHAEEYCGAILKISGYDLDPFLEIDDNAENMFYSDECELHCLNIRDLTICKNECKFKPYRKFILKAMGMKNRIELNRKNS